MIMLHTGNIGGVTPSLEDVPRRFCEHIILWDVLLGPISRIRQARIQSFHCSGEGWGEETREAHTRFFAWRCDLIVLFIVEQPIIAFTLALIEERLNKSGPSGC